MQLDRKPVGHGQVLDVGEIRVQAVLADQVLQEAVEPGGQLAAAGEDLDESVPGLVPVVARAVMSDGAEHVECHAFGQLARACEDLVCLGESHRHEASSLSSASSSAALVAMGTRKSLTVIGTAGSRPRANLSRACRASLASSSR